MLRRERNRDSRSVLFFNGEARDRIISGAIPIGIDATSPQYFSAAPSGYVRIPAPRRYCVRRRLLKYGNIRALDNKGPPPPIGDSRRALGIFRDRSRGCACQRDVEIKAVKET